MSRFAKWSVWITSFLTAATGIGYFVMKYLLSSPEPYAVINHPWQPFFLKAHIVVSPLLLFALGVIAVEHVWQHFVTGVRVSRRTAILTGISVVPMVLTGYLIQVLTDEGWILSVAVAHIAFGGVYAVGLLVHSWIIRRTGERALRRATERGEEPGRRGPGGPEREGTERGRAERAGAEPVKLSGTGIEG